MLLIDRFLAKVEWSDGRHDGTRCLVWTGSATHGYGQFKDGKLVQAHPYSGDNLYVKPNGCRVCRACAKRSRRQWRSRR